MGQAGVARHDAARESVQVEESQMLHGEAL